MSEFWEVFREALGITCRVSVWAYINWYIIANRRAVAKLFRGCGAWEIHKWREQFEAYKKVFPWIGWEPETVRRINAQCTMHNAQLRMENQE